jgi:hypothetical protein
MRKAATAAKKRGVESVEANMSLSEANDDFVVLTGSHVVSPSRQLMIKFGRFDLEMNGVQQVEVYFDRELKPDRLMMPASDSPFSIKPSNPNAAVPLIPFFSKGQQRVFNFGFASRVEGGSLIFLLNYDERSASLMVKELARLPTHVTDDRPAEVMQLILRSIARLRDWPVRELSGGASIDSVELRVNHKFVGAITRGTALRISAWYPSEDILASWEVGQ